VKKLAKIMCFSVKYFVFESYARKGFLMPKKNKKHQVIYSKWNR